MDFLDCLPDILTETLGPMATRVDFLRLNEAASAPADPRYWERPSADKSYDRWVLNAQVDENPRKNTYGRVGGEVLADIVVIVYSLKALEGSTTVGDTYDPKYEDRIEYRGESYHVVRIARITPYGANKQVGYQIDATKFR